MLKISCGTDIIEIERIKKIIEQETGQKFLKTVYTKSEINYCESHNNNKFQHYAARFAAKEAAYKALNNINKEKTINWQNLEIINDQDGKPNITIQNDMIKSIDLSISHCKEYAVANVVILYE